MPGMDHSFTHGKVTARRIRTVIFLAARNNIFPKGNVTFPAALHMGDMW